MATSTQNYAELLEAKEIEQKKFEDGIAKLIKFKNQVKDLLDKNKKQLESTEEEKISLRDKLLESTQYIDRLKTEAKDAIEAKANSKFAQLSQQAAKELRTLKDDKKRLTGQVGNLTD